MSIRLGLSAVKASTEHEVTVELRDGRKQEISVYGLAEGNIRVRIAETRNGRILREEWAEG